MKIKNITILLLSVGLLLSLAVCTLLFLKYPQTGYVDVIKLYEKFEGKKELQARLIHFENHRSNLIDSLVLQVKELQSQLSDGVSKSKVKNQLQINQTRLQQISAQSKAEYDQYSQKYTEEIWTQINQYILDFGKQHGYDYIHGASGNGSLMYGNPENDITNDVLTFINAKYEGV